MIERLHICICDIWITQWFRPLCKDVCMELLFFFSPRCMSQKYIFKKNSGIWVQNFVFLAVVKAKISLT